MSDLVRRINDILYAKGAPLGSNEYFEILRLCCEELNMRPESIVIDKCANCLCKLCVKKDVCKRCKPVCAAIVSCREAK